MRNEWYGDRRDLVKWATLIHLVDDDPSARILQVLMMRPDGKRDSALTETKANVVNEHSVPARVFNYFRRPRHVQDIVSLDKRIAVYDKPFPAEDHGGRQEGREQYFGDVCEWIAKSRGKRRVVLVDPDTGIIENPTWRHIGPEELKRLYCAIRTGDTLALYQHQQRRHDWPNNTLNQFAAAIRVRRDRVCMFRCRELAPDVALFAVRKS